jgi:hypothetical protein
MNTCECGQPATEVCGARKHTAKIRELAAQGWMSQSATAAASPVGVMIRRRMQAA